MTARSMRVGFGFGPKTLRVSRTFVNALGVPVRLAKSGATARTLSVTVASVPVVGENVTLTYSGLTLPSAVSAFRITKQGDSTNGNQSPTNNVITMGWSAATAGTNAIDHYQIRRSVNGGAFADYAVTPNATTFTYTDSAATNAYSAQNIGEQSGTNNGGDGPTTVYDYNVVAVDTLGNRGPDPANCEMWLYVDGTQYAIFSGSDLSFGMSSVNFSDTTLSPPTGTADIKCTITGVGAGFQPPTFSPGTWTYGAEVGAFNYLYVTCKPIATGQAWNIAALSRGPPGDVFPHINLNLNSYGPAPSTGVWATYKIPLADFGFGTNTFTGSIDASGVLTVSSPSGVPIDCVGWISWSGQTTPTWISATPGQSGAGTYQTTGQVSVTSRTMTYHRSNWYKFQIVTQSGSSGNSFGVTNIKFSRT